MWESETTFEPLTDRQGVIESAYLRASTSIRLVDAPSPRPRGMSVSEGTIELMANPWAEIWIDGRHPSENFTETPFRRTLPVGPHVIRLANPFVGADETVQVIVEPARVSRIDRDWCVGEKIHAPGCRP